MAALTVLVMRVTSSSMQSGHVGGSSLPSSDESRLRTSLLLIHPCSCQIKHVLLKACVSAPLQWGPMIIPGKGFVMDASRANCRKTCEEQLVRLKVPSIQLWTMRGPCDLKVPLEETMQEVKVRQGWGQCFLFLSVLGLLVCFSACGRGLFTVIFKFSTENSILTVLECFEPLFNGKIGSCRAFQISETQISWKGLSDFPNI